jgi:hypothetical protein
VFVEVFSEAEIAARVKNERKRVVWSRINSEESDSVGVRELCKHPYLAEESLKRNVNHEVREGSSLLTRKILLTSLVS